MMLLYAVPLVAIQDELIYSHVVNMRLDCGILEPKSVLFGICTRVEVWPRGIKSRKPRRWLGSRRQVALGSDLTRQC